MHRLPDSEGMTLVKDIVAKWNKDHPNIQVKATKFDGAAQDMIKKLETDVKAGNAPDLAQVGYAEVPEVFTKGLLEDVTEEAAKYKSDFAEGPYSMMQLMARPTACRKIPARLCTSTTRRLSTNWASRFPKPRMS